MTKALNQVTFDRFTFTEVLNYMDAPHGAGAVAVLDIASDTYHVSSTSNVRSRVQRAMAGDVGVELRARNSDQVEGKYKFFYCSIDHVRPVMLNWDLRKAFGDKLVVKAVKFSRDASNNIYKVTHKASGNYLIVITTADDQSEVLSKTVLRLNRYKGITYRPTNIKLHAWVKTAAPFKSSEWTIELLQDNIQKRLDARKQATEFEEKFGHEKLMSRSHSKQKQPIAESDWGK